MERDIPEELKRQIEEVAAMPKPKPKGFAVFGKAHPNIHKRIASSGGTATHAKYGSEHMRRIGRRGGKS